MRIELDRQRQRELLQQEDAQRSTLLSPPAGLAAGPAVAAPPPSATPAQPPPPAAPLTSAPANPVPVADAERSSVPGPAAATAAATPPADSGALTLAQRLAALEPEYGADGRQMTLEDLVFEPGTATFAADAPVGIARVAAWLVAEPTLDIRIAGHTDATGSPEANRSLSLRRAEAVRDALVERGVALSRIAVSGEGAGRPGGVERRCGRARAQPARRGACGQRRLNRANSGVVACAKTWSATPNEMLIIACSRRLRAIRQWSRVVPQPPGLRGTAAESMQTNASPTSDSDSHHHRPMVSTRATDNAPSASLPASLQFSARLVRLRRSGAVDVVVCLTQREENG